MVRSVHTGARCAQDEHLARSNFYRHEMPVDNELSKQNIQDRYHGHNDPVARKILTQHASAMGLPPPEDQTIVCFTYVMARPAWLTMYEDIPIPDFLAALCNRAEHPHPRRAVAP